MSKVVDFDSFRSEQTGEAKIFRIRGKEYAMAPTIPAILILRVLRLKAEIGDDADVALDVFDTLGRAVFGVKEWDAVLMENQIGFEEIPALITAVIRVYTPKAKAGSPTSPTEPSSTTSSKRGRGSRRTSSASTGSTSSPS